MGGTARRIGTGVATGGFSELERNGMGPSAMLGGGGGGKGGGKGGSAPSAPDFMGAVDRQTQANRPNQNTPFANSQWTQDANGNWTQNVGLSGGLGQAAQGYQQQMADQAGQPIMTGDQAREQAINAAYGQASSRLDPQWGSRATALESALANKGLTPGGEAYSAAQRDFNLGRNDAYTSAMNSAIGQGTEAGNAIFNQNLAQRQLPMQQLQGLQGLSGMPGAPGGGNYLAALLGQNSADLTRYGIDQAGKNSRLGGMASLGALAASDERLKMNIIRSMLEVIPGVPFATWEWKATPGERFSGVIAQDLEKVRPDLVVRDASGMRFVDYRGLMEAANG
jgi:hypothetical protein